MPSNPVLTELSAAIRVSVDRGGTFSDVHASWPLSDGGRKEVVLKLLSVDLQNYPDAPTEGIRRVSFMSSWEKEEKLTLARQGPRDCDWDDDPEREEA
jgi:5-oxoprolinase (ATP-hydrolysing)